MNRLDWVPLESERWGGKMPFNLSFVVHSGSKPFQAFHIALDPLSSANGLSA